MLHAKEENKMLCILITLYQHSSKAPRWMDDEKDQQRKTCNRGLFSQLSMRHGRHAGRRHDGKRVGGIDPERIEAGVT